MPVSSSCFYALKPSFRGVFTTLSGVSNAIITGDPAQMLLEERQSISSRLRLANNLVPFQVVSTFQVMLFREQPRPAFTRSWLLLMGTGSDIANRSICSMVWTISGTSSESNLFAHSPASSISLSASSSLPKPMRTTDIAW